MAVALLAGIGPAQAQGVAPDDLAEGRGTAQLIDWPEESLSDLLREMGRRAPRLLPEIDSMALDYGYVAGDSTSDWSFEVTWRPGNRVLDRGRVKPWRNAPPDVRMVSLEVRGDVVVDGEAVAQIIIGVDSMALRPYPDSYAFDVTVSHDRVFLNTPPEDARRYLQNGAAIRGLVVERMGFASFGQTTGAVRPRRDDARQEPAPRPSIYRPRTSVWIGWRIGPRPYYVGDRSSGDRDERPRGETVGGPPDREATRADRLADARDRTDDRTEGTGEVPSAERGEETGRSTGERRGAGQSGRSGGDEGDKSGRSSGKSKDDDDDDDDTNLGVPALAAAAGVGLLAYAGGTVGLSGTGETPLGLTAGYTHPTGGVQLQASVNPEVFDQSSGQRLSVKALGFYDVFESRVQPAVGLGVQARGEDRITLYPAASVGLVGNLGRFVLYGGFDVAQLTPEVSLAYNFRFQKPEKETGTIARK